MRHWAIYALLGLLLTACGGNGETSFAPSVSASKHIPTDGLQSWVSYAHQVSVVRVVSETQLGPDEATLNRGEGMVGRSVTLQVETSLWVALGAEQIEGQIEIQDWGWVLKAGSLVPFTNARLEVGGRYLVPLADFGNGWGSLELTAIPIEGEAIAAALASNVHDNPWFTELAGIPLNTLADRLAATDPDPVAAQFAHLPPIERYEAVQAEARP